MPYFPFFSSVAHHHNIGITITSCFVVIQGYDDAGYLWSLCHFLEICIVTWGAAIACISLDVKRYQGTAAL